MAASSEAVLSAATTFATQERKRPEGEEGAEQTSPKTTTVGGNLLLEAIFNNDERRYRHFVEVYNSKKVIKGRVVDFSTFEGIGTFEVCEWIRFQGWEELMSCRGNCYARLVRVLICNYDVKQKRSWIGDKEIDLSPQSIRECLQLAAVEDEAQLPKSRGRLFSDLAGQEISEKVNSLHPKFLDVNLKLAHIILNGNIYPKVGGRDSISERDARVLWALKFKKKVDFARIMSEHIYQVKSTARHPLPYGMILTKFLTRAGVDLAQDVPLAPKKSDVINRVTLKKMGISTSLDAPLGGRGNKHGRPRGEEERQNMSTGAGWEATAAEQPAAAAAEEATPTQPTPAAAAEEATPLPPTQTPPSPDTHFNMEDIENYLTRVETSVSALQTIVDSVDRRLDTLISVVEGIKGQSKPVRSSSPPSHVPENRPASPIRSIHKLPTTTSTSTTSSSSSKSTSVEVISESDIPISKLEKFMGMKTRPKTRTSSTLPLPPPGSTPPPTESTPFPSSSSARVKVASSKIKRIRTAVPKIKLRSLTSRVAAGPQGVIYVDARLWNMQKAENEAAMASGVPIPHPHHMEPTLLEKIRIVYETPDESSSESSSDSESE